MLAITDHLSRALQLLVTPLSRLPGPVSSASQRTPSHSLHKGADMRYAP